MYALINNMLYQQWCMGIKGELTLLAEKEKRDGLINHSLGVALYALVVQTRGVVLRSSRDGKGN